MFPARRPNFIEFFLTIPKVQQAWTVVNRRLWAVPSFRRCLPASNPVSTGSIPSQSVWGLMWKIWFWDMLCFRYFDLSTPGHSITALHPFIHLSPTHYLSNWQRREITHVNKPIQSFQFRILTVAIINKESEEQGRVSFSEWHNGTAGQDNS